MVSRSGGKRCGSVYTESNYSTEEEDSLYGNDSDYSPSRSSSKMAKISTNNFSGGKGKTLSPTFCLEKQFQSQENGRRGPRPKCFSRNALMARENRMRKKMYMEKLEAKVETYGKENKSLNLTVDKQSCEIKELRKQVKYLKSVLANSSGIGRLLKGIRQCTGMSVTSSLMDQSKSLTEGEEELDKRDVQTGETEHPWLDLSDDVPSDFMESSDLFSVDDLLAPSDLTGACNGSGFEPFDEHNYNVKYDLNGADSSDDSDAAGICLHIAKNKVSLEFCYECNANAAGARETDEEAEKNEDNDV